MRCCGCDVASKEASDVVGQAGPGVGDLPLTTPALELVRHLDDLGKTGRADRMSASDQASAGVDGARATEIDSSTVEEAALVFAFAQPDVGVQLELRQRGRVVELDEIELAGAEAS